MPKKARTETDIRKLLAEINELESTVVQLKNDIERDSETAVHQMKTNFHNSKEIAKDAAARQWALARATGRKKVIETEDAVRRNPLRSVGMAFLGGLVTSVLMRRRSRYDD